MCAHTGTHLLRWAVCRGEGVWTARVYKPHLYKCMGAVAGSLVNDPVRKKGRGSQ